MLTPDIAEPTDAVAGNIPAAAASPKLRGCVDCKFGKDTRFSTGILLVPRWVGLKFLR